MTLTDERLGRIEVSTVPQPPEVANTSFTHFTYTGTILTAYDPPEHETRPNYYHLGVMNHDGSGFHKVFEGEIPPIPKSNGIRFLPMTDNKRIITGDYVIECEPDIDHCETARLVQIHYNPELWQDKATMQSWTEIIMRQMLNISAGRRFVRQAAR